MKSGYDVIGDVHGQALKLEGLLGQMDYQQDADGVYRHRDRVAIFVGDLIDRGEYQEKTLTMVKAMVDSGAALIVMGNHEFNALAFEAGLRPDTEHNRKQHHAFLEQLPADAKREYLDWFFTIPLWLEIDGLRVIHACWNQELIDALARRLVGGRLSPALLEEAARKPELKAGETINPYDLYWSIEVLLKGPEVPVTPAYQTGPGEKPRNKARLKWWLDYRGGDKAAYLATDGYCFADGREGEYQPDGGPLEQRYRSLFYQGLKPVVFGHYWRNGTPLHGMSYQDHAACVDFSAAKDGHLTAYRFTIGDTKIRQDGFVQFAG